MADTDDVVQEAYEEEEMEEDGGAAARAKKTDAAGRRVKGRGAGTKMDEDRYAGKSGQFESLADTGAGLGAQKSVEGWILLVMGVHEEAQEEDLYDKFSEYGEIKNLQLPLDRRTGFVKGYALIEYETKEEAQSAIEGGNGAQLLEATLTVDWAFSKGPLRKQKSTHRRT